MIKLNEQYPNKTAGVTANYPFGQARNVTLPGDRKGTPWDQALVNDLLGFQQAAMKAANMVPSGVPDNANTSQVLEALKNILPMLTFGFGQTRQNVTANRVLGTLYTNTTSKPITVMIHAFSVDSQGHEWMKIELDGDNILDGDIGVNGCNMLFTFVVPVGKTYKITTNLSQVKKWTEIR